MCRDNTVGICVAKYKQEADFFLMYRTEAWSMKAKIIYDKEILGKAIYCVKFKNKIWEKDGLPVILKELDRFICAEGTSYYKIDRCPDISRRPEREFLRKEFLQLVCLAFHLELEKRELFYSFINLYYSYEHFVNYGENDGDVAADIQVLKQRQAEWKEELKTLYESCIGDRERKVQLGVYCNQIEVYADNLNGLEEKEKCSFRRREK